MKASGVIGIIGLASVASLSGAAIPFFWHGSNQERTSRMVLKVFDQQWPDKPFEISAPKVNKVDAPSLFEHTPMMTEPTIAP